MASTQELLENAQKFLLRTYRQPPLVLTRGEGCRVWDADGRAYLDLYAGIAVCVLGHAHPAIVKAVSEQVARLGHVANYFYTDRQLELAAAMAQRTGLERVFFCNSGAEANEGALKLARHWQTSQGDRERKDIIATWHSFHGRTMGALAMTGQPKYWSGLGPMLDGVSHVAYGDLDAMQRRVNDRTAAIIVEPIQGEGGVLPAPEGYLAGLRKLCDDSGVLLIFDEIQTGIGRTGRFLASQHDGVLPDVVTLAKGLAGGVPIGVFSARERLADALPPGSHGSTFGGNPLAAASALAVLETLDREGLIEGAVVKGEHLAKRLGEIAKKHPDAATGARGKGLMAGLVLADGVDPRGVLSALRDRGVLLTLAGERVLRFVPALTVTIAELDEGLDAVEAVLANAPRVEA